jgi:hypothetical protein
MSYTPVEALAGQLQREQINRALGELDATGLVAYARISGSNYVLTNTTNAQRLFNVSTNGALTLPTGRYYFRLMLRLSAMSATSGNGQFRLVGAGTATVASVLFGVNGVDADSPLAANTITGTGAGSANSETNMVTATTGTQLFADISGHFIVEAAGTIVPSIALTTAAAANVVVGTWMGVWRLSDASANTVGNWT